MNRFLSLSCKIFLKPIVDRVLIKKVEGLENVPKSNFILAANHQSHLDQIATGYVCVPRRFHMIGQIDRYTGFLGILRDIIYKITGVIPVNRKDPLSKKKAIEKAKEVLEKGDILVIYPEGTRSRTGKLQPPKLGIAKIYLKTGVPILPVGIKGTFKLLPPGKVFPIFQREVIIKVGKPLFFIKERERAKNLKEDSPEYKEICKKIAQKVMEEIEKLLL